MIGALVAGRYRVEAELGRGGMGIVYRAAQLPLGRAVALKVLRAELVGDERARLRFEREARVASALAHPSAVTVFDFGEHAGAAFLVMELVEGPTLAAQLAAGPLGVARALALGAELADVLAAAHAIGLVHRDLTPSNVVIGEDRARVLDFGLAFLRAPAERGEASGRLTREGVVVGTPEYLSPEQARGEDVGPPTDVYALGCLLHEMLTGRPPFAGSELEVLTKQMFAPPPPLDAREPAPAALDELRRAMLDKLAARRPAADEVRDRLTALDPDPDRARARAREHGYLGARARRMVEAAPAAPPARPDEIEVGIVGAVRPELLLGLGANGFTPFAVGPDAPIGPATRALYAPSASPEEVRALAAGGVPVVTDAERGDGARLTALLRAGAADVVLSPVGAAELAKKLTRVLRRGAKAP
ncbi:MAG: serine/threonine protein kinase [Sandaracinaceae bacterium]|nr:serine/threonine protein kinase [Sandaracinaceae bacterium]